jgi:cell division protein FtsI/penicillin-binding protein 2
LQQTIGKMIFFNLIKNIRRLSLILATFSGSFLFPGQVSAEDAAGLPMRLPDPTLQDMANGFMTLQTQGDQQNKKLTIVPQIQSDLSQFIKAKGNPIAAVVLADIKTGKILAIAQGRDPEQWGGTSHTALHVEFPCASIFKTTVTAAAFEFGHLDIDHAVDLDGGCAYVPPTGKWIYTPSTASSKNKMSLRSAYGHSCNGFFAKIAITKLGVGPIINMAQRFGWNDKPIPADFHIPLSPLALPNPGASSASTMGKFAAGFGNVGMSALHAIWQAMLIANNGIPRPLQIFEDTINKDELEAPVISASTSEKLKEVMRATVQSGTASHAFRYGPYRMLKEISGGKTGTLTGTNPKGLTTWFVGMMPIDKPEVVVASVVILEDRWVLKATSLSAEAFLAYQEFTKKKQQLSGSLSAAQLQSK